MKDKNNNINNDNMKNSNKINQEDYERFRENVVIVSRSHYWVHTSLIPDSPEPHIWREFTTSQFSGMLASLGLDRATSGALITRLLVDSSAKNVTSEHSLLRYPLHPAGYQLIDGQPHFIEQDWAPIAAKKGDPSPIIRLILRMFHHEADLLLGWMKGAYMRQINYAAKARNEEQPYPPFASQTLCISGEQGTGKTQFLLRCVIAPLLGDFAAIPSSWLVGTSHFTDWMLGHTLYLSDDNSPLLSIKHRKAAATALKNLGYPQKVSCECKGKGAISVDYPNERVFLTNMSEDSIRALPDFTEDGDKFLVLHNCSCAGFVTDYNNDPRLMQTTLEKAVPAFAYWLLHDYTLPDWAAGSQASRHMVMNLGSNHGYISPKIKAAVAELDNAGILIAKIRRITAKKETEKYYCGKWLTLTELRSAIEETDPSRAELATDNALGRIFEECTKRWPNLVQKKRFRQGYRYWIARRKVWGNELRISDQNPYNATLNDALMEIANLTADDLDILNVQETDVSSLPDLYSDIYAPLT